MKTILWIAVSCAFMWSARADEMSAWKWEAPFRVEQAGMVRLEAPLGVLDASRADLADLRITAPDGLETPYLLEAQIRREGGVIEAEKFEVTLAGKSTVIQVDYRGSAPVEALRLVTPAGDFLKSVTIEGAKDGAWKELAANQVIFRRTGAAERLSVPLGSGAWDRFRITVNDERTEPVPFTGVRLAMAGEKPETREQAARIIGREEISGETRLTIDLGAGNLAVDEFRFGISDALFSRHCAVGLPTGDKDGSSQLRPIAGGTLYRVSPEGGGVPAEELSVPVRGRIPGRQLVVTIRNGDSPPLSIGSVMVSFHPTILAFHAGTAGDWRVLSGNRSAKQPAYDLAPLRGLLARSEARRAVAGEPTMRGGYQEPPSLPDVEPTGAAIDLKNWHRRRLVQTAGDEIIRLELDELVLSASRRDLGDLRLVRDGKQIPYQILTEKASREISPVVRLLPADAKRPSVSRWEIRLPVDGLPAAELTAASDAPLFSRNFEVTVPRKDDLGNQWKETLGGTTWNKTATANPKLRVTFGEARLPRTLYLETDHGDNPVIGLKEVTIHYSAPVLAAKLVGEGPVFLYYGNPEVGAPVYDLALVRKELAAADYKQAVFGGEEETLKPGAESRDFDSGSPWMWVALGLVVVVLLGIVAKLLPKPASS